MTADHPAPEFDDLLARARAREPGAIAVRLERHLAGLERYIEQRVGGVVAARETPADLVQSMCREVLEDIAEFDDHGHGQAAFTAWLYATAHRKIVDRHRYHTRKKPVRPPR